jgi:ATP-binding cassette subfamily B (MDR/TAP) protein 1
MVKSDSDAVVIDVNKEKPSEENIPPVPFTRLFRFSTRLEIFLDFIGIIAALGAGAAQASVGHSSAAS